MSLRRPRVPFGMWLPITVLAMHFFLYSAARLALYVVQSDSFTGLDFGQVLWAFIYGLRFDASMIFLIMGLPLLLTFLPLPIFRSQTWRGLVLALAGISLVLHGFLFFADTVYFSYVNRHIGMEFVAVFSDTKLFTAMMRDDYAFHLSLFFLTAAVFGWLYYRLIFRWVHGAGGNGGGWLKALCFLILAVVTVRGGVTNRKSVNIVHAFDSSALTAGYLTLNAPFSVYHTVRSSSPVKTNFLPKKKAIQIVRNDLALADSPPQLLEFPLYRTADPLTSFHQRSRSSASQNRTPPNVVIIMLESWDAWFVDAWRQAKGMPTLGLTPEFDQLASEGRLYTDFYATGQRSVHGVAAILASMPTLPGMPYIGTGGMEQNQLSFVSTAAKEQGYATFFIRSAGRESYRLDRVAQVGSFDLYQGSEDILQMHPQALTHKFGVWDDLMFSVSVDHMQSLEKPYFGFLFPSSTHHPFAVPDPVWQRSPDADRISRFKDSLHFSDHTVGEFFRQMRKDPRYDNTLFVITADHVSGVRSGDIPILQRFLLPCLLIGPGIQSGVDDRTSSQLDIAPTIIDFCGWPIGHASLGNSLLAQPGANGSPIQGMAIMATEHEVLRKQGSQWVLHNLHKRLDATSDGNVNGAQLDEVEKKLLAMVQAVHKLLGANKIMPASD